MKTCHSWTRPRGGGGRLDCSSRNSAGGKLAGKEDVLETDVSVFPRTACAPGRESSLGPAVALRRLAWPSLPTHCGRRASRAATGGSAPGGLCARGGTRGESCGLEVRTVITVHTDCPPSSGSVF